MRQMPEKNKRPGVIYPYNREGVELPVIDITHPAFAVENNPQALAVQ
jgi:hypothetical protein